MYVFINKEVVLQNSHLFPLHSSIYSVNLFLSFSALSMSFYIHYPCPSPLSLSFYKLFFSPPIPVLLSLYQCPSFSIHVLLYSLHVLLFFYTCPSFSIHVLFSGLPPYPCPSFSLSLSWIFN